MKDELLITQILSDNDLAELIYIFNKQSRLEVKRRTNEDSED